MPQTCTVCRHKQRHEIDKDLLGGGSLRGIAGRYKLSKTALERHKKTHIPEKLARAKEASDQQEGESLSDELRGYKDLTLKLIKALEKKKDYRGALLGVRVLGNLAEAGARHVPGGSGTGELPIPVFETVDEDEEGPDGSVGGSGPAT